MMVNGREGPAAPPHRPPNPALPYREDCWSEGETSALVDAWGGRYVELNRGNLRQKHWQEVADAVNSRRASGRRPPRTDVQCKNRIDTLKKKYKSEKARISGAASVAGGGAVSQWPFFDRLDSLIGALVSDSSPAPLARKPSSRSPPLAVPMPMPFLRKASPLPATAAPSAAAAAASVRPVEKRPLALIPYDDLAFRRAQAAAAAAEEEDVEEDEEEESGSASGSSERSARGYRRAREMEGVRQLARAITRFADIYERVEVSKQRQMMEMEKQRMEFAKALEFQRMQIFVDSQVQLEKIKRAKRSDTDNYL